MNTGMLLTGSMTVSWNGTLKEGLISWQLNIWDSVPLTALWWYWTASRMPPTMRIVEMNVGGQERKLGKIIELYGEKAIIQVFEGTENMALRNTPPG